MLKKYPRNLILETKTGEDGYPVYRRRKPGDGGFTAKIKMKVDSTYQEIEMDNRWVVPFTPILTKNVSKSYKCRIMPICQGHQIYLQICQ